jgi:hypothetical protein
MTNKKKRRPKQSGSFKSMSAARKEIELMRDWAECNTELEFIVPLEGGSIKYSGRIVDTSGERIATFHFVSHSGMQAIMLPQTFGKCRVEKFANLHNGLHVESQRKGSMGFSLVESLIEKKPNANLANVVEKLRIWEKLQLELHVFLNRGDHAISFLGQICELSSGIFSFAGPQTPAQLLLNLNKFQHMGIKTEDDKSSVILINHRTQESCLVSDAATQPADVFARFEMSSIVH